MYTCASFFAGVGGIDKGFENAGIFKTIYANEFDPFPVKTYEKNFDLKVDCRDIREVKASEIPDFKVMLAGFPCQAFSVAGYRKGFDDEKGRGTLFFELVRIFKEKKPEIIFLENVKNLVSHDNGNTFQVILQELQNEGYSVKFQVLNAMEYGNIPQNRERIYIVAFKNKEQYKNFEFPLPIKLETKLSDVIDFNTKIFVNRFKTAIEKINNIELTNHNFEFHCILLINLLVKENHFYCNNLDLLRQKFSKKLLLQNLFYYFSDKHKL